jgi:hypothetical protein
MNEKLFSETIQKLSLSERGLEIKTIIEQTVNVLREEDYSDQEISETFEKEILEIDNSVMIKNNEEYLKLLKEILKEDKL